MDSQRIVYMEDIHRCPSCNKLICRATRQNGTKDDLCACEETELLFLELGGEE